MENLHRFCSFSSSPPWRIINERSLKKDVLYKLDRRALAELKRVWWWGGWTTYKSSSFRSKYTTLHLMKKLNILGEFQMSPRFVGKRPWGMIYFRVHLLFSVNPTVSLGRTKLREHGIFEIFFCHSLQTAPCITTLKASIFKSIDVYFLFVFSHYAVQY
jgi:hypothetical protein